MKKSPQRVKNENIHQFLNRKTKHPSLSFISRPSNIPKLSEQTLNQIQYLIDKKMKAPSSFSIENQNVKNYLSTLSIREKYEDLLNRNSLILPPKYKILLKKQSFLDYILSTNDSEKSKFNYIKEYFEKHCNLPFTIDDFEKILFIAPFYYIYQAKKKINNKIDLICIDLPSDFDQRTPVRTIVFIFRLNFII